MVEGQAGETLTNIADTTGSVLTDGMNGDFGTMTSDLTSMGGTIATDAGAENVGAEITDWGNVAG